MLAMFELERATDSFSRERRQGDHEIILEDQKDKPVEIESRGVKIRGFYLR